MAEESKDGRATTSAENGKLGGRPISVATLRAQAAREYISNEVEKNLAPIVSVAIVDAMKGDYKAREWLSHYAWGKPAINLGTDGEGQPITITFDAAFAPSLAQAIAEAEVPEGESEPAPLATVANKDAQTPAPTDPAPVTIAPEAAPEHAAPRSTKGDSK